MGGAIPMRRCPVVVGRDVLLQEGCDAIVAAAGGRGGCLALAGEEGPGRSRVLGELVESGRVAGLVVLAGRAVPKDRSCPYRPLSEALSALLRGIGPSAPASLAPFVPVLAGVVPRWGAGRVPPASPLAVADATLGLLRELAPRGTLLVVEDLEWADADTLAAVEFLADNARDERLLLVLTGRPGESRPLDDLLRSLRARGAVVQHALGTPFGLSARELEVLRLIEDGLTNRAAAARLSISHRTVEKHVERLLAKTGARNRAQLGAIAALGVREPSAVAAPEGRVALRVVGMGL